MLLQINKKVISKKFPTRRERLGITEHSPEKSSLANSDYYVTQKIIGETVKIEGANKDMQQKQTSWKKEGSANAEFDSENDQSKLWKTCKQIAGIYSERVESTPKYLCDESIVSTNLVEEKDKISSSYKDCEKLGTVFAHSDHRKKIIDIVDEYLVVELNTPATKVSGSCQSGEFDFASEDLKNKKECCNNDSDENKSNRDAHRKSTGIVDVQPEGLTCVAIGCQKDKPEETSSVVTVFADKNKYSCNESTDEQSRNNFDDIPLPILLLTYKNHALDEFLLKMVESFGMGNVLRIGGRSKEPKLDECNLNNQLKNAFLANGENAGYIPKYFFQVKREIDKLQKQVDKIMDSLQSSTQISKITLLRLLDDRQIMTLLQKSRLNKSEERWLQLILNRLYNEGNYVGDFLLHLYQKKKSRNRSHSSPYI